MKTMNVGSLSRNTLITSKVELCYWTMRVNSAVQTKKLLLSDVKDRRPAVLLHCA